MQISTIRNTLGVVENDFAWGMDAFLYLLSESRCGSRALDTTFTVLAKQVYREQVVMPKKSYRLCNCAILAADRKARLEMRQERSRRMGDSDVATHTPTRAARGCDACSGRKATIWPAAPAIYPVDEKGVEARPIDEKPHESQRATLHPVLYQLGGVTGSTFAHSGKAATLSRLLVEELQNNPTRQQYAIMHSVRVRYAGMLESTTNWTCVACDRTCRDMKASECAECKTVRPRETWKCGGCGAISTNMEHLACSQCWASRRRPVGLWSCKVCTFANKRDHRICAVCGAPMLGR